ncbi:hypothetical protein, partial [Candidatus Odyssella thessalonicensis]|uniref:hypothetical protein n=1 Tax=Candidatus Odyssella thessalonicensis TaxID=84647 RepID=UPI000225BEC3
MKATGALFRGTSIDLHAEGPREFGATPMHGRTEEVGIKDTTIREWCTHLLPRLEVTQATETAADPAPRILGSALPCLSRDSDSLTDYYENPVSTEGNDCAFNCLGISRNEAVVLLLEQKYNEEARRLVAPEIRLAYIAGDLDRLPGFANMPAYQSLKAYLGLFQSLTHLFKTQLRSALGLTENQSWRDAYTVIQRHNLQAQYPEFMEKANHYLNFDAELRAFSELPEVYERYLYRYLGTNEMMGYQPDQFDARLGVWKRSSSAFDLLTRLLGQKLQIMFKNKQTGAFELIHEDDFDGEPITLLHTLAGVEGGHAVLKEETETKLNHFNVLLTENEQQDFSRFYDHKAAEGQAYISSGGNAFDQGLQTQALKGVIKRSGGALIETTVQNWMREQTITRKKKWNGKNKTEENTHFTLQNQGCTTITKENDVEYYAA